MPVDVLTVFSADNITMLFIQMHIYGSHTFPCWSQPLSTTVLNDIYGHAHPFYWWQVSYKTTESRKSCKTHLINDKQSTSNYTTMMPLAINALGGGHTHTHTHTDVWTKVISRNQMHVSLRPKCAWFKIHSNASYYMVSITVKLCMSDWIFKLYSVLMSLITF